MVLSQKHQPTRIEKSMRHCGSVRKAGPKSVPEARYLRQLGELQDIRVSIQNEFDFDLRVPNTGYLREFKLLLRIMFARFNWIHRVGEALGQHIVPSDSPTPRKERNKVIAELRQLEATRKRLREILHREIDIEIDTGLLHPRVWTIVRDSFKVIEQLLQLRIEAGLLGVDLDSPDDNEPTVATSVHIEAMAS